MADNPERFDRFVARSINLKYMNWQCTLLDHIFETSRFTEKFSGVFRGENIDYKAIYRRLYDIEMDERAKKYYERFVVTTPALVRFKVKPPKAVIAKIRAEIEKNTIDPDCVKYVLDRIDDIIKKNVDYKKFGHQMFLDFIEFSDFMEAKMLGKDFNLHRQEREESSKQDLIKNRKNKSDKKGGANEEESKPKKLEQKKEEQYEDENIKAEEKEAQEDEEMNEEDESDVPKASKKERKKEMAKITSEKLTERVPLVGLPFSLEVTLFTLLTKIRIWHKLIKSPSMTKMNRIEFLSNWFKGLKDEYRDYIVTDTCPWSMDIKDLRSMRNKIYYQLEDNGWIFELAEQNKLEELKAELNKGIDANLRNGKRKFKGLLHIAAIRKNLELVELLEKYNVNPDILDRHEMTPLFYAIESNYVPIIKKLLQMGANVEHRDEHNATPFYWAVYCATLEILKILQENGAEPAVVCMLNRNALLKAAFMNKSDVVQYLLTFPSVLKQINESDQRGRTPLHAACWGSKGGREGKRLAGQEIPDSKDSLELLLDGGADVRILLPSQTFKTRTET
jgi:hypothetical protein